MQPIHEAAILMRLAAVPNEFNDHPNRPRLRLVPPPPPAPRMSQREMVILSLIRCPGDPSRPDLS